MTSVPPPVLPPPPDPGPERDTSLPPERAALPPTPWWAPLAAGLTVFFGLGFVVAIIAGASGETALPDWGVMVATIVQDAALIGVGWLYVRGTTPGARLEQFGLRRMSLKLGLKLGALAFVVFWGSLQIYAILLDPEAVDDLPQELGADESTIALLTVAGLVCILAPLAEELFFRGFVFTALWRATGWIPAAAVTGLLFGLVHAAGTPAIFLIPLAALGFILCALYRRTGSLLPGMGLHAVNNALALGVSLEWSPLGVLAVVAAAPTVVVLIAARCCPPPSPA